MTRWVQLELRTTDGAQAALKCAFYHVCAVCGEQRAVLTWREEGSQPEAVGALCPHLQLELTQLRFGRFLEVS